ncbi:unnamed protein product, partial [marine sediment metagenome]
FGTLLFNVDCNGNVDVLADFTAGTIQADNGYTGFCSNITYLGGIAITCND